MINIIALKETFCSSSHSQGEIAGKIGKNNHNKALIECELAIWKMLPRMLPARKKVLPGHTTSLGPGTLGSTGYPVPGTVLYCGTELRLPFFFLLFSRSTKKDELHHQFLSHCLLCVALLQNSLTFNPSHNESCMVVNGV
jgi:hypothetical protein